MSEEVSEVTAGGRVLPSNWLAIIGFIWGGQAFSIITSYAAGYAAVWYITETTESPMMLSIAAIVSLLPTGLISPFGGVLADRFNRRTIMLISDASVGLLSAILGVIIWLGQANLFIIMVVIAARGIAQAFHSPAMTAAMPMMVPEKHLLRINSLSQMIWSIAGIGSPVLGIFLYTTIGFESVMFLDAAGAVLACLGLGLAKIPTVRDSSMDGQHVLKNLGDGLQVIHRNRALFILMMFCTCAMVIFMPVGSLFPLMTAQHFQGNGYMASLIEGVFGAAMLIGSVILLATGGGKRQVLLVMGAGLGVGLTTLASGLLLPDQFWLFVILSGLMGVACAFYSGPLLTIIQRNSPKEKLGRVMGLFGSVTSLASPIGLVIAGFAAELTGIALWFVISGALMLVISATPLVFPAVLTLDRKSAETWPQFDNNDSNNATDS